MNLIDADVLIEILRGSTDAVAWVQSQTHHSIHERHALRRDSSGYRADAAANNFCPAESKRFRLYQRRTAPAPRIHHRIA